MTDIFTRYEYLRGDNGEKPDPNCESGCVYRLREIKKKTTLTLLGGIELLKNE